MQPTAFGAQDRWFLKSFVRRASAAADGQGVSWLIRWRLSGVEMDQEQAASFVGKYLLIGITSLDHEGNLIEQRQFHGRIVRVNEHEGIVVKLSGSGDEYALPPDLNFLQEAPKGEYRLHSTGEVVTDPDLLTSWTINKPESEDS